jgi:CobQ-like glutamine amidotransferase family enzyme
MVDVESHEKPFGNIIYGFGNTGKDRNEGIVKYNSIFTNVLGPMLVLNPWLTKEIILKAAEASGLAVDDFNFDMSLEKKSISCKKPFVLSKKTNLTNCK